MTMIEKNKSSYCHKQLISNKPFSLDTKQTNSPIATIGDKSVEEIFGNRITSRKSVVRVKCRDLFCFSDLLYSVPYN